LIAHPPRLVSTTHALAVTLPLLLIAQVVGPAKSRGNGWVLVRWYYRSNMTAEDRYHEDAADDNDLTNLRHKKLGRRKGCNKNKAWKFEKCSGANWPSKREDREALNSWHVDAQCLVVTWTGTGLNSDCSIPKAQLKKAAAVLQAAERAQTNGCLKCCKCNVQDERSVAECQGCLKVVHVHCLAEDEDVDSWFCPDCEP